MAKTFSVMQLYAILMHDQSILLDCARFSISNVVGYNLEHHRAFSFLCHFSLMWGSSGYIKLIK